MKILENIIVEKFLNMAKETIMSKKCKESHTAKPKEKHAEGNINKVTKIKHKTTTKITLPSMGLIHIWWRKQRLYRQAKVMRI